MIVIRLTARCSKKLPSVHKVDNQRIRPCCGTKIALIAIVCVSIAEQWESALRALHGALETAPLSAELGEQASRTNLGPLAQHSVVYSRQIVRIEKERI